jgi:thiol-disulfide isomerase/thioredoxin
MRPGRPSLAIGVDSLLLRSALLIVVLLLATAVGLVLRWRAGRARDVAGGERLAPADLGAPLGERATFVQFSSPACSPCRSVRRVLTGVVADQPGLAHVEIDATERLDLARRLKILRTPTVLLLDPAGHVVRRISGALTPDQARAAVPEPTRSRS